MQEIGAFVPPAAIAVIVFLIVRARLGRAGMRFSMPRFTPRPRPKKTGTLLRFEPSKLDDELQALLRKRR
jgi:hypothetical protein